MADKLRVLTVFGTRPEAIKMAPVVMELARYPEEIESCVVVTAQHRDMLDVVLNHFSLVPDYDLDIMRPRQSLTETAIRALKGLEPIFYQERPDLVLVHGDTLTTGIASLGAFFCQLRVGHVEAGLRTGNKWAPFPEEVMRKVADNVCDLHFCPTSVTRENLAREGIAGRGVYVTGNTAIDALLWTVDSEAPIEAAREKKTVLVDVHRRESFGEPLERVARALAEIADSYEDVHLVVSVHPNPAVKEVLHKVLKSRARVDLLEPLSYVEWARLMQRSFLIITDSGGLQEEAPALGVPVLLTREQTERPEAVAAGTVRIVGTDPVRIVQAVEELTGCEKAYQSMVNAQNPYGDGQAARRTVEGILHYFERRANPPLPWIAHDEGGENLCP